MTDIKKAGTYLLGERSVTRMGYGAMQLAGPGVFGPPKDRHEALAVLRELRIPDDAPHVNPNGGAIALGHPLGASGARLITAAILQLRRVEGHYALCTMCIGVGQGIAMILERV